VTATGTGQTGHDSVAAADLPPASPKRGTWRGIRSWGLFPLTVRNRDWTRDARAVPPICAAADCKDRGPGGHTYLAHLRALPGQACTDSGCAESAAYAFTASPMRIT